MTLVGSRQPSCALEEFESAHIFNRINVTSNSRSSFRLQLSRALIDSGALSKRILTNVGLQGEAGLKKPILDPATFSACALNAAQTKKNREICNTSPEWKPVIGAHDAKLHTTSRTQTCNVCPSPLRSPLLLFHFFLGDTLCKIT